MHYMYVVNIYKYIMCKSNGILGRPHHVALTFPVMDTRANDWQMGTETLDPVHASSLFVRS